MNNKLEKIMKITKEVNKNIERNALQIPILNSFEIIKQNEENIIFIAKSKDNNLEQFIEDGNLSKNETYKERLDKVIEETINSMTKNNFINPELNIAYIEKYKNNDINIEFDIYVQNNIIKNTLIKQMNAYFIEPKYNVFYEISLTTTPVKFSNTYNVDIDNKLTRELKESLMSILQNIKYN
jgi:bifunctional DNA-binding transcriptional regulator/antitoxin component of YhaV-PrlF toxin-antitoxin module